MAIGISHPYSPILAVVCYVQVFDLLMDGSSLTKKIADNTKLFRSKMIKAGFDVKVSFVFYMIAYYPSGNKSIGDVLYIFIHMFKNMQKLLVVIAPDNTAWTSIKAFPSHSIGNHPCEQLDE